MEILFVLHFIGNDLTKGSSDFPCYNGYCDEYGTCQCESCWGGESCNDLVNNEPPVFLEKYIDEIITVGQTHVATVRATDGDCDGRYGCPCGQITYFISAGNDDSAFTINPNTGEISVGQGVELVNNRMYEVSVQAKNRDIFTPYSSESTVTVFVSVSSVGQSNMDSVGDERIPYNAEKHSRHKRAVPIPALPIPVNLTLTLSKWDQYENVTTMFVGDKVKFRLAIHVPSGSTDIYVELFTPDNDTTVMMLCNPVISHVGSNLDVNSTSILPVMDSRDQTTIFDRASIDFGLVVNSGMDDSDYEQSMIYIDYCAVMIDNAETVNGSVYWVSAGVEYENVTEIWVCQNSFMTITDIETITELPTFNYSGPTEMEVGSSIVFTVDMFIPYPSVRLSFDAFAPLNTTNVMSICAVTVKDVGDNYKCLDTKSMTQSMYPSENGDGNYRGHLDIATVTNAGLRENQIEENRRITVELVAHVYYDDTLIGQTLQVGAAVELDSDQIWAGLLSVNIIAASNQNLEFLPSFAVTVQDGNDVQVNYSKFIYVDMDIPAPSESDYELRVQTPVDGFKICSVSLIMNGFNIPCVPTQIWANSSSDGSKDLDTATHTMYRLTNVGMKTTAWDETVNRLRYEIVVTPLTHTSTTVTSTHDIVIGMQTRAQYYIVSTTTLTIIGPQTPVTITNDTKPDFSLSYGSTEDGYIPVGGSAEVLFEMTTKAEVSYDMMDLELLLPVNNDTALYTVCDAQVVYVGRNHPCVNIDTANAALTRSARFVDGDNDKVVLQMGPVCNHQLFPNTVEEDKIVIKLKYRVRDHVDLNNGTQNFVSAGALYSQDYMTVAQISTWSLRNVVYEPPSGKEPEIFVDIVTLYAASPPTYPTIFHVVIQTIPGATVDYSLQVVSRSADMSICGIKLVSYGSDLPCLGYTDNPTYTTFPTNNLRDTATINFGPVTNNGTDELFTNNSLNGNTIVVEVKVQLLNSAADTSVHSFDATVTYGATLTKVVTDDVTTTLDRTVVTLSTDTSGLFYNFFIGAIGDGDTLEDTAKGQVRRFLLEIDTTENVVGSLVVVTFLTSINQTGFMEICDVNVISVGANLPCMDRALITGTYLSRNSSYTQDLATLDLGFVCNVQESTDPNANKIVLEALVKVYNVPEINVGERVYFSAASHVNDIEIMITEIGMSIISNVNESVAVITDTSTILNIDPIAITMNIRETKTFSVTATIPRDSTMNVILDVDLPVSEQAAMTVENIRFISAGRNLACLGKSETFSHVKLSNQGTSQMDSGYINIGAVTNTGVTYRMNTYGAGDDDLIVEFDIQMADALVAEDNAPLTISFGTELGIYVALLEKTVTVTRDNTEALVLDITASADFATYIDSDTISCNISLAHASTSTAEGREVGVFLHVPKYLTYYLITTGGSVPTVTAHPDSYVEFTFPNLFFKDSVQFFAEFTIGVTKLLAGQTLFNAITPYDANGKMHYRTGNANPDGTYFSTDLEYISCDITSSAGPPLPDGPLGVESFLIQDCQITSSPMSLQPANQARKGGTGWSPFVREGLLKENRYVEVYFGNRTEVTKITLINTGTVDVTSLMLSYSDDGESWTTGATVTPTYSGTEADIMITNAKDARFIRLNVLNSGNDDDIISMTFELYGHATSTDVPAGAACRATPSIAPEFYYRGFLTTTLKVYACDATTGSGKLNPVCYSSAGGDIWDSIDESVANVVGYDNDTSWVYGIGADKNTYMVSEDDGVSWEAIQPSKFIKVKALLTYIGAISVPWSKDGTVYSGTPVAPYLQGDYGANNIGVYKNMAATPEVALDWTTCCA